MTFSRSGRYGLVSDDRNAVYALRSMRNTTLLVAAAVVIGVALVVIGIVYLAEPAKSLPSFFPGHEAGSAHHHVKHGIASFFVGLAAFAFAWFQTGPKNKTA